MDQVENSLRSAGRRLGVATPRASSGPVGEVSTADVFAAVAQTVGLERGRLNGLSSFTGAGTGGDRVARAFADVATAVSGTSTGNVADELNIAGQVLLDPSYGKVARYFAQGLFSVAPQFAGRTGLTMSDLGTLLNGLLEGAKQDNPAQVGQGTLLDVLNPAVSAYAAAQQRNLSTGQRVQGVLGASALGVRQTMRMPGVGAVRKPTDREDWGATATQAILTGLVKGLLGARVPATPPGQSTNNFILNLLSQGIDLLDLDAQQPQSGVADMLSASGLAGNYDDQGGQSTEGYGAGGGANAGTRSGT